jgi:hypothetical protein
LNVLFFFSKSITNRKKKKKKKKQEKKRKHTILVQNTIENDKGEISIQNRYQIGEFT